MEVAAALFRQVAGAPHDLVARHNLAVELRKLDRAPEALEAVDAAWSGGLHTGETATMRGHILADIGHFAEAEAAFREAIRIKPELIEPHQALASLLPQIGRASEALDGFREGLARSPGTGILWVEAMSAAKAAADHAQLLQWAQAAERRFGADTMIATFAANALSGLGRDAEARERLAAALAEETGYASGQATLAHVLIRLGDYRGAEDAAVSATTLAPHDQSGWALLNTIWRLVGDPREDWLCGYDTLVMELAVDLPPQLAQALTDRHLATAHPAGQSLRGGTQTAGNLFHSADPLIVGFAQDVGAAIEAQLSTLPVDPAHPFLARNTGRIAFSASWSVRLGDAGFHISHMHPAGWLSSALYVSLPEVVAAGGGAGGLAFGVPDAALGLDLPPRRTVQPREGLLVLFPSYLWHGTTPFHSDQPRLTVAFDALPMDNPAAAA